jgi:Uma2 family endonuclease
MASTLVSDAPEAIEHLPAGGTLILPDVSWNAYERLLLDLGEGYGVRIHYDTGMLSIMSPSARDEKNKELILRIADTVADELGLDLESFGSTTFKKQEIGKGAEPDTCFYVQNAASVAGKGELDLALDPPPDVIVEIDLARSSTSKFSIYQHLKTPELWLYDGAAVQIFHLTPHGYTLAEASQAFPILTSSALTRFLNDGQTKPASTVLRTVRHWLRADHAAPGK